jgi:hypothetical protein
MHGSNFRPQSAVRSSCAFGGDDGGVDADGFTPFANPAEAVRNPAIDARTVVFSPASIAHLQISPNRTTDARPIDSVIAAGGIATPAGTIASSVATVPGISAQARPNAVHGPNAIHGPNTIHGEISPAPRAVTSDEVLGEWKNLHRSWGHATRQSRAKRELDEKRFVGESHGDPRMPLTRMGGTPIDGFRVMPPSIEIEPPALLSSASMGMLVNLLLGSSPARSGDPSSSRAGGVGGGGLGVFDGIFGPLISSPLASSRMSAPTVVTTEVIRSPSGQSSQVITMSSSSSSRPAARMVFNDRRLDAAAAAATGRAPSSLRPSSTEMRDLFRTGQQPLPFGSLFNSASGRTPAAAPSISPSDSIVQAILNRSLYDHQPANLRNGGTTLIQLDSPPPTTEVENCPICLDGDREQPWARCPSCRNPTHLACAKTWLTQRATCVICRAHIP